MSRVCEDNNYQKEKIIEFLFNQKSLETHLPFMKIVQVAFHDE
jgi:hypothetical protein